VHQRLPVEQMAVVMWALYTSFFKQQWTQSPKDSELRQGNQVIATAK
jgi:hypothetical protein